MYSTKNRSVQRGARSSILIKTRIKAADMKEAKEVVSRGMR